MPTPTPSYPNLTRLMQAYYHQDWALEFSSPLEAARRYAHDTPPRKVKRAAREIGKLLAAAPDEAALAAALDDLGCAYSPQAAGQSPTRFLSEIQQVLIQALGGAER
jgi:hypothetical protein